jgi:hypothetical protein
MMESSGVSDGKLARRCRTSRHVASRSRGNQANVTAPEMLDSAFRQNFDDIVPRI